MCPFLECHEEEQYDEIDDFSRYRMGFPAEASLDLERARNMRYLVAYDICEPRRLHRVAKLCEQYGMRIEYSVFECDLDAVMFHSLWQGLAQLIDSGEDSVVAYKLCATCERGASSMGIVQHQQHVLLYMI